jgi:hypothetical protein
MKKIRFIGLIIIMMLIIVANSPLIHAAEVEGAYYRDSYTYENVKINRVGVGLFRYWAFKAYTGALYLEEGASADDVLSDRAKRIELEYMRPIKGKDFGPATEKMIIKNVESETYTKILPQLKYHNSLYEDVRPGDRYSLTYIPGIGTELALNGESKGIIEGADFASAVFSIWLGPKPISRSFKNQLLGLGNKTVQK